MRLDTFWTCSSYRFAVLWRSDDVSSRGVALGMTHPLALRITFLNGHSMRPPSATSARSYLTTDAFEQRAYCLACLAVHSALNRSAVYGSYDASKFIPVRRIHARDISEPHLIRGVRGLHCGDVAWQQSAFRPLQHTCASSLEGCFRMYVSAITTS